MSYHSDKFTSATFDCSAFTVNELSQVKATIEQYGAAIVPSVLTEVECNAMKSGMVSALEHITSDSHQPFIFSDESTWRNLSKYLPLHSMLFQHYGIGQAQFIWDIRQNPTIRNVFTNIWETNELLVSFDGCSFHLPPEKTNLGWFRNLWLHVDQSFEKVGMQCVQGSVTANETNEGDATFCFLQGSHALQEEFSKTHTVTSKGDWYKFEPEELMFYYNHGCQLKRVTCPAGSLILWDSRTVHCGVEALHTRAKPNIRYTVYVCYTPRDFCTESNRLKRIEAFESQRMTSHWPHYPKLFPLHPRTYGKDMPVAKELPKPVLSEVGYELVGYYPHEIEAIQSNQPFTLVDTKSHKKRKANGKKGTEAA